MKGILVKACPCRVQPGLCYLDSGSGYSQAPWSHEDKSEVDFGGVLASAVIQRKFRLESAGLVGFSSVGSIDATVDVDGKKVTRRTKVQAEGSATFVDGVIAEQAGSWTTSSEATEALGASKNRTTVRLRLVK